MVDLHCHILPNVDDGARSLDESLAMAEDAINDGITHVVATPHASSTYPFDYVKASRACALLREKLNGRLILATGCDFHLSPENLAAVRKDSAPFCINQNKYLLLEFNEYCIPLSMDQIIEDLQRAGLCPVVTHPERNAFLHTQPERLERWVHRGCFAQITASSLNGTFGSNSREDAWNWIARGLVHFISSDAHNTAHRPLKLKFAYDAVAERFGEEKARALLVENPRAAFEGRPLPHVPNVARPDKRPQHKHFLLF
jgi:protein-tyrosine phosphatase